MSILLKQMEQQYEDLIQIKIKISFFTLTIKGTPGMTELNIITIWLILNLTLFIPNVEEKK